MSRKLAAFLYLLMRDEATCGVVAKLVADAERVDANGGPLFTNKHLAAYAVELANRLEAK